MKKPSTLASKTATPPAWDGVPRLSAFLSGAAPTPHQRRQARQWLDARSGLYRLGIPFERAIQCESVRIVIGMDSVPRRNSQPTHQQEAA